MITDEEMEERVSAQSERERSTGTELSDRERNRGIEKEERTKREGV